MEDFDKLPKMAGWNETQIAVPEGQQMTLGNLKPNYNITFHRNDGPGYNGTPVGTLDFNGGSLVFTGDAEDSAKVFIDWIAKTFKSRLEEEYMRGYGDALKEHERTGNNE